jgi:hypothetical protein
MIKGGFHPHAFSTGSSFFRVIGIHGLSDPGFDALDLVVGLPVAAVVPAYQAQLLGFDDD